MEGYNGFTSWIEDDCPDNFLKLFSISFLQLLCVKISHWLTVLEHKILFKSAGSRFGLVNVVHLCTHTSDNRKSFWNQRENLHSTFQCYATFLVLLATLIGKSSIPCDWLRCRRAVLLLVGCPTHLFIYISQLLGNSFSVSQQPPSRDACSHYSMF